MEYDEEEAVVMVKPVQGRKKTLRLGESLSVKEIKQAIERGRTE